MKKYLSYIILVSLLLVNLWLISNYFTSYRSFENFKLKLKLSTIKDTLRKRTFKMSLENENVLINTVDVYPGLDSSTRISLVQNISEPVLIFRFSGNYCDKCTDFVINSLKKHFKDYKINKRIVLVCSDINPRFKESYYGKPLLSFYSGNFKLPLEQSYKPFLFVLDEDGVSKMVFVPDPSYPEYMDIYLETIKNKLF